MRHPRFIVLLIPLLVVAGCSAGASGPGSTAVETHGVVPDPPLPVGVPRAGFDPELSLASVDGAIVASVVDGALEVVAGGTGAILWSGAVSPTADLRVVSAFGDQVALFENGGGASVITVVDVATPTGTVRRYEVEGLVEPEAFSTDGGALFVIDHQAARQPGAYRVRPLDLATGTLEVIVGPTKVPFTDDMNGTGRRQVWSPDGSRLYTLYLRQTHLPHGTDGEHEHQPGHDEHDASDGFVHVLDLAEEWAFCLELPPAFGTGDLATTALGMSPDGSTLAVASVEAGQIALASTSELAVSYTRELPAIEATGDLHLALTDEHLVLGSGSDLWWFERSELDPVGASPTAVDADLIGLTSTADEVIAWATSATAALQAPAG